MNTNWNQIVVSNGTERHVLSIPTGYYTYLEFIEAVGTELNKVITTISITIEDKYVKFNVEGNGWYFDRDTTDTTIDGFGWTPWFKLSPSTQNLCIKQPVDEEFDINGSSLPDKTNNQGLCGYAFIGPTYVEYDWQMMYAEQRFIDNPLATYVMTNSDGSIFDSGSFYLTENNTTTFTMEILLNTCLNELNNRYDEIRNIPPSHQ